MAYRTRITSAAQRRLVGWNLSDFVFTEVTLRLHQILPANPTGLLRRVRSPRDCMAYEFDFIDPENRLRQHFFSFVVFYGQDEETLYVVRGAYVLVEGV